MFEDGGKTVLCLITAHKARGRERQAERTEDALPERTPVKATGQTSRPNRSDRRANRRQVAPVSPQAVGLRTRNQILTIERRPRPSIRLRGTSMARSTRRGSKVGSRRRARRMRTLGPRRRLRWCLRRRPGRKLR